MAMVTDHKRIEPIEYRVWVFEGHVVGHSPYSWDENIVLKVPDSVINFVYLVIHDLEYVMGTFVVDLAIQDDYIKVIELNSFSTSGWYAGLNVKNMLRQMEKVVDNMY